MKKYPIPPFRDPIEGMCLDTAESIIEEAFRIYPGRPLFVESKLPVISHRLPWQRQEVKIEEIGNQL